MSVEPVRREADRLLANPHLDELILDLAGVEFMDSSGLGLLVHLRKDCAGRGVELRLRNLNPTVRRLFAITGMLPAFTIDE